MHTGWQVAFAIAFALFTQYMRRSALLAAHQNPVRTERMHGNLNCMHSQYYFCLHNKQL